MSDLLQSLIEEVQDLKEKNEGLSTKLSIALEGLKALASDGNILGIPQKTLDEITSLDEDLPQDDNVDQEII